MKGASRMLLVAVLLGTLALAAPSSAQGGGDIQILHAVPSSVLPDLQINLTAVLTNATSAEILWNNGSMAQDAVVPMTNLSRLQGGGWVYDAWLPGQPDGTQVTYTISATGPGGTGTGSYFLTVSGPSASGLATADQEAWMLTMAASVSMAASTIAVLYWYTGRRLRRGVK